MKFWVDRFAKENFNRTEHTQDVMISVSKKHSISEKLRAVYFKCPVYSYMFQEQLENGTPFPKKLWQQLQIELKLADIFKVF